MRLIAAILGFAASVLGVLGTTEVVAAPPSAAVVYSYDVPHHAAPTAYSNPDRGPPAGYDTDIRSAVDLVSRGASARRQFALALGHTTYDGATRLVLVNEAISTANEQPQGDARALTSFARSGVAANGGDDLLRLSTKDSWAGSTPSTTTSCAMGVTSEQHRQTTTRAWPRSSIRLD